MSAIINQTKQLYRRTLRFELFFLLVLTVIAAVWQGENAALSFVVGGLAGFLPHCLFVYWVFFRAVAKNMPKMTAFYSGEGLKWASTIVLIIAVFIGYANVNLIAFFAGYFLVLLLNSLLPILLKARA